MAVVRVQRHEHRVRARAASAANAASARAPSSISRTAAPEANAAPPVVTCTMPSEPASAKPRSAAFSVAEDVTFTAGSAYPSARAASSSSA